MKISIHIRSGKDSDRRNGVLDAFLWFDSGLEDPNDGPHTSLGAEGVGAVAKCLLYFTFT